eukprot:521085_1
MPCLCISNPFNRLSATLRHLLVHWIISGIGIVDNARFVATEPLIYGCCGATKRIHATINTNQHVNGPIRITCKMLLDAMLSIIIGNKVITNQHEFGVLHSMRGTHIA